MAAENEIDLTDIAAFLPENLRNELTQSATEQEEPEAEKSEATEDSGNDETAPSGQEEASTPDDEKQENDSEQDEESSDEENDDADEADEDTEKGEARSPKADKLLKRIDKLTAKRREAEEALEKSREEAEKLRVELAGASKVVLQPTPEDPLSDVESIEELDARIATAKRVRTWAMSHRDGATVKGADGSEEYVEPAEMARHLAAADAIVTDHGPARKEWLTQRETSRAEALTAYPEFFTEGTAESKALRDILKHYPGLAKYANFELIIPDAIRGQQARWARQEAQAKAKAPAASPSRKAQSPAPEPPKVTGKSKIPAKTARDAASLKKVLEGQGDRDSVAALMESLLG